MTQFEFWCLVLDAQIGHWNLSIHNLKAVLLGDSVSCVRVVFFRRHLGQIAIQISLEFIVEEHADRPASAALDAGSLFLIEPVEIGVVSDFARFQQTVVDGLIVGKLVRRSSEGGAQPS